MHETRHDLTEGTRTALVDLLNARLADAVDLRQQTKVAHWNVKGPSFFGLHKLFDEVAAEVDEYVDLLAERVVQLGGVAEGTVRQVSRRSGLDEYAAEGGGKAHVPALADALADFARVAREAFDTADAEGDQVSADIFTEIARGTDKWLWMVEAHLPEQEARDLAERREEAGPHVRQ